MSANVRSMLTIRAYARHRGVSHTAVRKAVSSGRITLEADGTIDPAKADVQWDTSTDLSKPRNSVTGVPKPQQPAAAAPAPVDLPYVDGSGARLASSYAASRAAHEGYRARLAKLELEQRSGKLVDADEVRAQFFALGRRLRDALMGFPDRLAPVLAGETDPHCVHEILVAELTACLAQQASAPAAPTRRGEAA